MLYKQGCCPLLQKSNKHCCVLTFLCMMFAIILIAGIALGFIGYQYETVEYSPIGDSFASFYVKDNVTMFIGVCIGTILAIIGFFGFIITSCFCCINNETEYDELLPKGNGKVEPHYYPTPNYQ
ncbi:Hypothetical_protein [Hexamita inflata]|uniref:Hypothetical_protein n=1 Tax=Hexamita inflata TaxID=28002 RepID=A0AA86QW08_9EUKA|nr:Hypothetical protein HINF_LOCUS46210 [Hexamita inflata]